MSQPPVQWAKAEADVVPARVERDTAQPTDRAGGASTRACLDRIMKETGERNVAVLSSEFSQANSVVMVGMGSRRARWRCLVSNDGMETGPPKLLGTPKPMSSISTMTTFGAPFGALTSKRGGRGTLRASTSVMAARAGS
jgi:hypothetical protein